MKKCLVLFLMLILILPITSQREEREHRLIKEIAKSNKWTAEQISKFQKELNLIQKNNPSYYDWMNEVPYKLEINPYKFYNTEESPLIKPDLVPPGSLVVSSLNTDRNPQPSPLCIPNAIPGNNPPIFIPIHFYSYLKWLNYLNEGD